MQWPDRVQRGSDAAAEAAVVKGFTERMAAPDNGSTLPDCDIIRESR